MRSLAYKATKQFGIPCPAAWEATQMSGRNFYYGFMARHPKLTLRTPEHLSANRIKAFNRKNVHEFFTNLTKVLAENNFGTRIYNMDETGFPTVPNNTSKVIAEKGSKRVSQFASEERGTNVTVAFTVDVTGNKIPPFFLFPRKKLQSTYTLNAPLGSIFSANGSGWMTRNEFDKFMDHFIKEANCRKGVPTLLLLDNHTSHLSLIAINKAIENDITMVSFPPHTTDRLQPLDVGFMSPVKEAYHTLVEAWCKSHIGQKFEIHQVAGFVNDALKVAGGPQTIQNAFKATGISPLNPLIFTDADFLAADLLIEAAEAAEADEAAGEEDNSQQRLFFFEDESVGNIEEVSSSETSSRASSVATASGSHTNTPISRSNSLASIASTSSNTTLRSMTSVLDSIGPVQFSGIAKKSTRGRKPMKSSILTSSDKVLQLQAQAQKQADKEAKKRSRSSNAKSKKANDENNGKEAKKRSRSLNPRSKTTNDANNGNGAGKKTRSSNVMSKTNNVEKQTAEKKRRTKKKKVESSSESEAEAEAANTCHGCSGKIEEPRTKFNFIQCFVCRLPHHLSCATKQNASSVFVCKDCDSDYSEPDESDEYFD